MACVCVVVVCLCGLCVVCGVCLVCVWCVSGVVVCCVFGGVVCLVVWCVWWFLCVVAVFLSPVIFFGECFENFKNVFGDVDNFQNVDVLLNP